MSTLSNIALALSNSPSADSRNVTVTGKMKFDASDVGKTFHLEIHVFGEDKAGDNLPAGDTVGDNDLYAFQWGSFPLKKTYKSVVVNAPGELTFTETRSVGNATLDEDTGTVLIGQADINTPIFMPRKDEVYAKAILSAAPTTARSSTVIAGIGI